jgi:hypothetical protein
MFGSDYSNHASKEVVSKYKAPDDWRASCQDLLKDCAAIFSQLPLDERIRRLCIMLGAPNATQNACPISKETAAYNVVHMRRRRKSHYKRLIAPFVSRHCVFGRDQHGSLQSKSARNITARSFIFTRYGCHWTTLRSLPPLPRPNSSQKDRTFTPNGQSTRRPTE